MCSLWSVVSAVFVALVALSARGAPGVAISAGAGDDGADLLVLAISFWALGRVTAAFFGLDLVFDSVLLVRFADLTALVGLVDFTVLTDLVDLVGAVVLVDEVVAFLCAFAFDATMTYRTILFY